MSSLIPAILPNATAGMMYSPRAWQGVDIALSISVPIESWHRLPDYINWLNSRGIRYGTALSASYAFVNGYRQLPHRMPSPAMYADEVGLSTVDQPVHSGFPALAWVDHADRRWPQAVASEFVVRQVKYGADISFLDNLSYGFSVSPPWEPQAALINACTHSTLALNIATHPYQFALQVDDFTTPDSPFGYLLFEMSMHRNIRRAPDLVSKQLDAYSRMMAQGWEPVLLHVNEPVTMSIGVAALLNTYTTGEAKVHIAHGWQGPEEVELRARIDSLGEPGEAKGSESGVWTREFEYGKVVVDFLNDSISVET